MCVKLDDGKQSVAHIHPCLCSTTSVQRHVNLSRTQHKDIDGQAAYDGIVAQVRMKLRCWRYSSSAGHEGSGRCMIVAVKVIVSLLRALGPVRQQGLPLKVGQHACFETEIKLLLHQTEGTSVIRNACICIQSRGVETLYMKIDDKLSIQWSGKVGEVMVHIRECLSSRQARTSADVYLQRRAD